MTKPGFENPQRTPIAEPHATSHVQPPKLTHRQKVVANAHWGVVHEPLIHYTMGPGRDDWLTATPANHLPLSTDCSGFATLCYFLAGAPDPNGLLYKSLGYTGTMLQHGTRVPLGRVRAGDLVVYGCKTNPHGHHVAVVTGVREHTLAGIDTVSHGQEKGPFPITVAEEAKWQPDGADGVVFLSFLP